MFKNVKVAVLIPCYNEELSVSKVVKDFKAALPDASIYVFDNNSQDNTIKEALSAGALVRSELQQGKGHVVRRMFRDIDADFYIM
ncbi:MAG: glycosyltransferase, partial [Methylomonas sp.]